jgi:hypothetical protein
MQGFPDKMAMFDTSILSYLSGPSTKEQYMLS